VYDLYVRTLPHIYIVPLQAFEKTICLNPQLNEVTTTLMKALHFGPLDLLVGEQCKRACLFDYGRQPGQTAQPVVRCFRCNKLVRIESRNYCVLLCLDLPQFNLWSHISLVPSENSLGFEPYHADTPLPEDNYLLSQYKLMARHPVTSSQLIHMQTGTANQILDWFYGSIRREIDRDRVIGSRQRLTTLLDDLQQRSNGEQPGIYQQILDRCTFTESSKVILATDLQNLGVNPFRRTAESISQLTGTSGCIKKV
jgi:hypothetical protein